jgi:hypothetical protein
MAAWLRFPLPGFFCLSVLGRVGFGLPFGVWSTRALVLSNGVTDTQGGQHDAQPSDAMCP